MQTLPKICVYSKYAKFNSLIHFRHFYKLKSKRESTNDNNFSFVLIFRS